MQLNENKQTNGTEICKLFGIPPSILLGGATEQDKVNYVDMIVDLLTAIETSLDRDFLLEREKQNMRRRSAVIMRGFRSEKRNTQSSHSIRG